MVLEPSASELGDKRLNLDHYATLMLLSALLLILPMILISCFIDFFSKYIYNDILRPDPADGNKISLYKHTRRTSWGKYGRC